MGNYFNPAENVQHVGRKLDTKFTYRDMVNQLKKGEVMAALMDRGQYYIAPQIHNESEFDCQFDLVLQRRAQLIGFYALTEEQWAVGGNY